MIITNERSVSSPASLMGWCPTMDLLALSFKDLKVLVSRMAGERAFQATLPGPVGCLTWSPNGKEIVFGGNDGRIHFYLIEKEDSVRSEVVLDHAITCLAWAGSTETKPPVIDRIDKLLPHLYALPEGSGSIPASGAAAPLALPVRPSSLSILACGSDRGSVRLMGNHTFNLGEVSFVGPVDINGTQVTFGNPVVRQVAVSDSLSRLAVCLEATVGNSARAVYQVVADISAAPQQEKILLELAMHAAHLSVLRSYLQETLRRMGKAWGDCIKTFLLKLNDLAQKQADHNIRASKEEEFLALLSCGAASPALSAFITQTLGIAGITRLTKAMEQSAGSVQNLIVDHMQPAASALAFRVSELRGLASWQERYGAVGMDPVAVTGLVNDASALVLKVEEVGRTVQEVLMNFKAFFNWLLLACYRLSDESVPNSKKGIVVDTQRVADFIQKSIASDCVQQYFVDAPLSIPPPWWPRGVMREDLPCAAWLTEETGRRSLMTALNAVCAHDVFSRVPACLSAAYRITSFVGLCAAGAIPSTPSKADEVVAKALERFVVRPLFIDERCTSIVRPAGSPVGARGLWVVRSPEGDEVAEACQLNCPDGLTPLDAQHYKDQTVVLLMAGGDESRLGTFSLEALVYTPLTRALAVDTVLPEVPVEFSAELALRKAKYTSLALSSKRGLGAALSVIPHKLAVVDLEEEAAEASREMSRTSAMEE